MTSAKHCKEISVRIPKGSSSIARLTKIVAEKGVSIRAVSIWEEAGGNLIVHMVSDDNLRAQTALGSHGYEWFEFDVIEVPMYHSPGMLSSICQRLENHGIALHHLYASAPMSTEECLCILSTSNNERALVLLNS